MSSTAPSIAFVMHGRLAGWQPTWTAQQTGWDLTGVPDSTLKGFVRFLHGVTWKRIIEPNRRAGIKLDIYIHSWNPELGPLLDELYQPTRSKHEPVHPRLHRVASQHLSIKTALQLAEAETHELVLVARHDVLWYSDFMLANMSHAPLWLPQWCTGADLTPQLGKILRPACAAGHRGYPAESYIANEPPAASLSLIHI